MKSFLPALFVALVALALPIFGDEAPLPAATPRPRTEAELAGETVVVFNQNSIESTALAGLYAEKRKIPTTHLVGLRCPDVEEISRQEYDEGIAEPLRKAFVQRGWWTLRAEATEAGRVAKTTIRFVVLMRGVPLKIAQTSSYEGDSTEGEPKVVFAHNEAAVDSELAFLGMYSKQISGPTNNPYYRETKAIEDTEADRPLLVCRLDGMEASTVRRVIEDTIAVEQEGLRGFVYVDTQGLKSSGLMMGDSWLNDAARDAREHGLPVILDNGPSVLPPGYPLRNCALYLGWYAENISGAFADPGFRLPRGAVAYHIHSFSALSLRFADRYWCAPLLEVGAVATMGNVYEPFLGLLPRPNVFSQRLREGFTFAEAAYMSQQYLSWMTTFVGDPLYRPFLNSAAAPPKAGNEWDAYREGVSLWLTKGRAAGEAALKESATKMKSGIIEESLGLLELSGNDSARAIAAFDAARAAYEDPADRTRVILHEAGAVQLQSGVEPAIKFLKAQAAANPKADILLKLAGSLAAEAKAPAKKPGPTKGETPAPDKKPTPAVKPKKVK